MRERSVFSNIDWWIVFICCGLMFFGWINIYSAMYNEEHQSIFDLSQRYGKQFLWIALSLVLGFMILLIDAKFFNAFSFPIYILMLFVLTGVLFFGKEIAGSKSWIRIGSFALQPAEFAKFATALIVASYLGRLNVNLRDIPTRLKACLLVFIPAFLILAQNDTGSALVFASFILVFYREGMSGLILVLGVIAVLLFVLTLYFSQQFVLFGLTALFLPGLFFVKRNKKNILRLLGVLVVCCAFVFSVNYIFENVLGEHQKSRINVLLGITQDLKGVGYNINQSKIAIGSGGFFGKGFLNGTQTKYNFVPEQSTDFIFCTVGEEWGFVGCFIIIGLYVALLVRLIILSERQRSAFSRIYGYSIACILFSHFTINIGMTIGLMPVIGIPLPFFSYGGSSLWAFTIMLFVFLKQDASRLQIL